ncbi:MAG: hypothetical protein OEY52_09090 [Gammaproteobacteria bacterium]|nr:hypothetical protein [Gammaproteobacteria bacterium]
MKYLALVMLSSILFTGCAYKSSMQVPLKYTKEAEKADLNHKLQAEQHGRSCKIKLTKIEDKRFNKQSLGIIGRTTILSDNLDAWVRQGVIEESKNQYSLILPQVKTKGSIDLSMELQIRKAYIHSINASKTANIVLKAKLRSKDIDDTSKYYRGGYTSINWDSSEDESHEALNKALFEAIHKLNKDILSLCKKT